MITSRLTISVIEEMKSVFILLPSSHCFPFFTSKFHRRHKPPERFRPTGPRSDLISRSFFSYLNMKRFFSQIVLLKSNLTNHFFLQNLYTYFYFFF